MSAEIQLDPSVADDHDWGVEHISDTDETGNERGDGREWISRDDAICSTWPRFITATRSDMDVASSWSWVTKTKVLPVRF